MVTYRSVPLGHGENFFREAGDPKNPVLVLLHGFPSSSFLFRNLIEELQGDFHLIAPDYPGFGLSAAPLAPYTFARLADDVDQLLEVLQLSSYGLYLHDFGAPVGLRIATKHPDRVVSLIVQNGNVYHESLSPAWDGMKNGIWKARTPETEAPIRALMGSLSRLRGMYLAGVRDPSHISPDNWRLDYLALQAVENVGTQLALLADYPDNVSLYPAWHALLRERQPPTLITWGTRDMYFTPEGAHAYLRELPDAEVHMLETGHFALEEESSTIAGLIRNFYGTRGLALLPLIEPASAHH